jgi:hypothetical protein
MGSKEETVKHYLGDMIAVERYITEAAAQQLERGRYAGQPEAALLVQRVKDVTGQHLEALAVHVERLGGGEPSRAIKESVTGAIGSVVDLFQQLRSEQVSKMLRDHYTALSLTKISYVTLHTTALALDQRSVADQALKNMGDIIPLLQELETDIVKVTAYDIRNSVAEADISIVEDAARNVREAA